MTGHATWSPSGATYWYNWGKGCPARTLPPKHPEPPSPAAEEGTRLHEVAEGVLNRGNWRGVSKEDKALLESYVGYVQKRVRENPIADLEVEAPCYLEPITGEKDATGTADALLYNLTGEVSLEVVDLKTGMVRVVPEQNLQLIMYLVAIVIEMVLDPEEVVRGTIAQGGEIRSCDWMAGDLLKVAEDIQDWCSKHRDDRPEVPSDHNCTWCPHVTYCPSLVSYRDKVAAAEFAVPQDGEELSQALHMAGPLKKHIQACEAKALEDMQSGRKVPGFKLVEARTNRRWADNAEEELVALLGDAAYDRKLIGITAGEKTVPKETMERLTIKPKGKPTIAPEDDPRPTLNDAAEDFANV